jgi:hypothetical protein
MKQELKVPEGELTAELAAEQVRNWLAGEGAAKLEAAMQRAQAASDTFASSTRVRQETLLEPVAY